MQLWELQTDAAPPSRHMPNNEVAASVSGFLAHHQCNAPCPNPSLQTGNNKEHCLRAPEMMHICLPMPATHYRVNIAPWQLYISTGSHRQRLFSDTSRLVLPHAVYRPAASYTYNLFPDRSEQALPTVYRPED